MGVLSLNSNLASLQAQRRVAESTSALGKSLQRLSSGLRVDRASDDAAGLSVSSLLKNDARVYAQAVRNANDGISALNIAEGSVSQFSNILTRLKELAESASNGTFSRTQRLSSDTEAKALTDEYNRLVESTKFNGRNLLDGSVSTLGIQLGYGTNEQISFSLGQNLGRTVSNSLYSDTTYATEGTGVGAASVATGDINGDGRADIVFADGGGGIYAKYGNANGTLSAATQVSGAALNSIALTDMNGDGKLDIVGADQTRVQVLAGNGSGGFGGATNYTVRGASVGSLTLTVADFNGDGKSDVALMDPNGASAYFLMNNGNGGFGASQTISNVNAASSITAGDLNGDGKADLILGDNTGTSVIFGSANGLVPGSRTLVTSQFYDSMVVGDFNHDGILDFAAAADSGLSTFQGKGDGTFNVQITQGASYSHLAAIDANGDGYLDLAATSNTHGSTPLTIFTNSGTGTFASRAIGTFAATSTPYLIAAADFNGDGVVDFAAMDSNGLSSNGLYISGTTTNNKIQRLDLTTQQSALSALGTVNSALSRISKELGAIGSSQSRLDTSIANLNAARTNYLAANSRIEDVDVASEAASLVSNQIRQQVGAAILAQANQEPRIILDLLSSAGR